MVFSRVVFPPPAAAWMIFPLALDVEYRPRQTASEMDSKSCSGTSNLVFNFANKCAVAVIRGIVCGTSGVEAAFLLFVLSLSSL